MKNIVLIGMPGAGKSTIGVLLAKTLKRPFIDTDLIIQTTVDRYLQDIINTDGINAFLDLESRVIRNIDVQGHVIATGGSVIYQEATMAHLRAHGIIVYLSLPLEVIAHRLRDIATRGIVARPGQPLQDLYEERRPLYTRYADLTLDCIDHTPEEIITLLLPMLTAAGELPSK